MSAAVFFSLVLSFIVLLCAWFVMVSWNDWTTWVARTGQIYVAITGVINLCLLIMIWTGDLVVTWT